MLKGHSYLKQLSADFNHVLTLSFGSCISLIDVKFIEEQLVSSRFFSFLPKSGKRISMLNCFRD